MLMAVSCFPLQVCTGLLQRISDYLVGFSKSKFRTLGPTQNSHVQLRVPTRGVEILLLTLMKGARFL